LIDQPLRMRGDAKQYVLEIEEGRDVDQFATLDEGVQQGGAAGAFEAAGE